MTKTFTPNDLMRLAYHEVTEKEKEEIEKAILFDQELAEHWSEISLARKQLDNVKLSASKESLKKVFEYSKSLSLHASHK
jgi:hypothetical protein